MSDKDQFWIFGRNAVEQVLSLRKRAMHKLVISKSNEAYFSRYKKFLPIELQEEKFFDKLFPSQKHQKCAIKVSKKANTDINYILRQSISTIVILDQISDPMNFGAILRNCAAFDVDLVVIQDKNSVDESAIVAKNACGGLEIVNIYRATNLANFINEIKQHGFWCFAMDGDSEKTIEQTAFPKKTCVIFGSEGSGIRKLVLKKSDEIIKINMSTKIESLNVASATAIALANIFQKSK